MIDFSSKPVFLAPMAGITDSPFRQICKAQGVDICESEMVSSRGIYYKDKKTESLMFFTECERPFGIQIFGSEPEIMAFAAKHIFESFHPDYLDINMGCPMPKIVKNGDGSSLLADPDLAQKIVIAIKKEVPEITLGTKIRKGIKNDSDCAVEFSLALEEAGIDFITVHGRTAQQLYTGKADYDCIAKVKEKTSVPIIANGDIFSAELAKNVFEYTCCDGIMVGRGSLGNPFIFSQIKSMMNGSKQNTPSIEEKLETAMKQLMMAIEIKGEKVAALEMRKHFAWYIKGISNSAKFKQMIFNASSLEDYSNIVSKIS